MDYKQIVGLMGGCNVKEVVRELNWEYLKMQTKKKDFFFEGWRFYILHLENEIKFFNDNCPECYYKWR